MSPVSHPATHRAPSGKETAPPRLTTSARHVYEALERVVSSRAEAPALAFRDRLWSYRALKSTADRMAAHLAGEGVKPGDRVMMAISNRPEFIFVFFALMRIGAVAVPVDVRLNVNEIANLAKDCRPVAIIADTALVENLSAAADRMPDVRLMEMPDDADARLPGNAGDAQGHASEPDEFDTAVILYTSGTTGHPKGACISHFNLLQTDALQRGHLGLTEADRVVTALPLSHVSGLVCCTLTPLLAGAWIRLQERFNAGEFLAAAQEHGMTYTLMVPTMYNLCLRHQDFERTDLSAWRIAHYGAAPMPQAIVDTLAAKLPELQLVSGYGSTELTATAIMMPLKPERQRLAALGKALHPVEIRVVDPRTLDPVSDGEEGELWVKSPGLIARYWEKDAETAEAIVDGFWRSGDIVRVDADGFVHMMDRLKDMINRGGYKIFPAQVESVIAGCDGVVEVAIIGRADEVLGERVHAFIQANSPDVTPDTVVAFCRRYLADYEVPETYTISSDPLPRNSTGKLSKKQMRADLLSSGQPPLQPAIRSSS